MNELRLEPVTALSGTVALPGSKSISNRALLLSALAAGTTTLSNLLDSDDTQRMLDALNQLGVPVARTGNETIVTGRAGQLTEATEPLSFQLGLAGTALRPLTAALSFTPGTFTLDGVPRMRERPVGHLVDPLLQLGADIEYLGAAGYPPLRVSGKRLIGGRCEIAGNVSSQFLTSLLMAAPLAEQGVVIQLTTELVSKPYIDITLSMMRRFGIEVIQDGETFRVEPGTYQSPGRFLVEGDASSASYFLAAGAIRGEGIEVTGIGSASVQGDVAFIEVLKAMGAQVEVSENSIRIKPGQLRSVTVDLNHIPDAAMTAAVLALFADGPTTITNIGNWRVKETDRLTAMSTELTKLGANVEEGPDYIKVQPGSRVHPASIDTYGDHRMAMCFSLAALAGAPVTIRDPECVNKTFPEYFDVYARLAA